MSIPGTFSFSTAILKLCLAQGYFYYHQISSNLYKHNTKCKVDQATCPSNEDSQTSWSLLQRMILLATVNSHWLKYRKKILELGSECRTCTFPGEGLTPRYPVMIPLAPTDILSLTQFISYSFLNNGKTSTGKN